MQKSPFYSFEFLLTVEGETLRGLGVGTGAARPLSALPLGWAPGLGGGDP